MGDWPQNVIVPFDHSDTSGKPRFVPHALQIFGHRGLSEFRGIPNRSGMPVHNSILERRSA